MTVKFHVEGKPVAQPRARACWRGRHAGVWNPPKAKGWKALVSLACPAKIKHKAFAGPVALSLAFSFARPPGHSGTGRNAGSLKRSAPLRHIQKPDLDNLAKSTMDALTEAGVWRDDCQVVGLEMVKAWDNVEGVTIHVKFLEG